ncbi:MAG: hypothetical protein ACQERU_13615, partial [Bacteroidota bacterium]
MRLFFKFIIIPIITIFTLSCEKEEFYDSDSIELKFSQDTIMFDTVFTTIGSSTRFLTVQNP